MATSQQASASASGSSQAQTSSSNDGTSSSQSSSASSVQSTDRSSTPATTSSSNTPTTSPSSTPTPTSTNAPTSASPATTTTPATTTPTTSPTAGQTTTSSPAQVNTSSSTGSPATTAAPTSSSITFTSQVATTFLSTNSAGSVVIYTTTVPEVVSTTVSTTTSGHSGSSHTGVIVGSVVGGVAGLALIVLLFFCIRRRVRNDEFDGNFDPDHVGGRTDGTSGTGGATLPQVDFADEVTAVTPYPHPDNGSMRQYGETPYLTLPSSPGTSAQFSSELYGHGMEPQPQSFVQPGPPPSGFIPPVNFYGAPSDWSNRTSPPPSTVSNRTSSARAAKEREAVGRQAGTLGLATQAEAGEGSGEVVVHEDAGRAPSEEHAPPREIPPSYDSIRQD